MIKKTGLLCCLILLLFSCYRSWNGLQFDFSNNNPSEKIQDMSILHGDPELFAVKYGSSMYYPSAVFYGAADNKLIPFDWLFYVVRTKDFILLIDTGFDDQQYISRFKITHSNPLQILKLTGIQPEDVTHVIITHGHFDHIGMVHEYKNAEIIISDTALVDYLNKPVFQNIKEFLQTHEKIKTFSARTILFDSILIEKIGGHAPGSSSVSFIISGKKYMITGDEAYVPENIDRQIPVGTFFDLKKNRTFIESLQNFDGRILTFHDPALVPTDIGYMQIY